LLGIPIVPFDAEAAHSAAVLAGHTRRLGLSLGDRACLALGILIESTVVTANQGWAKLDVGLEIEVIR
jgi:PIN domain nuclease of toxin-antitoxin system